MPAETYFTRSTGDPSPGPDPRDFRAWLSSHSTATEGPAGASMYKVSASIYDEDGTGDGNLTESLAYGDGTTVYTTQCQYDWQDRQTDVLTTGNVVSHTDYNDLGQVEWNKTYASNDFTLDSDELRAENENLYDNLGRVYESRTYEVDPGDGTVGDYLAQKTWYDPRGMVVKTATANGLFQKAAYDGAGRLVTAYTCYDVDEGMTGTDLQKYTETLNVTGDTVVEQTTTWYDQGSRAVGSAGYQRFPGDTSTTGDLTAANSYVTASINWYDTADRPTYSATYGREDTASGLTHYIFNGTTGALLDSDSDGIPNAAEGSPPSPNTSDNYIVARTYYDPSYSRTGPITRTYDNAGHIAETQSDLLGRTICTIQNRYNGTVEETDTAQDLTTRYQFDSQGRLAAMVAVNAKGSGNGVELQTTAYLYESKFDASLQTNAIYPDSADMPAGVSVALAQTGGVATATTTAAHGYLPGDWVLIQAQATPGTTVGSRSPPCRARPPSPTRCRRGPRHQGRVRSTAWWHGRTSQV